MEGIKYIAISICVTAVATAIFTMLIPNGRLEKTLRFAISLFFLASLISPFFNKQLDFRITMAESDYQYYEKNISAEINRQFLSLAQANVQAAIEKALENENISTQGIYVSMNIYEDESISISEIDIVTEEKDKAGRIIDIVYNATGIKPTVFSEKQE